MDGMQEAKGGYMRLDKILTKGMITEDCLNLSYLSSKFDSYEEIPLIDRCSKIKKWKFLYEGESILPIWINISYLIIKMALSQRGNDNSIILSFPIMDEKPGDLIIPHIFVTSKEEIYKRIGCNKKTSDKFSQIITSAIKKSQAPTHCKILKSQFFDKHSETTIRRYFCLSTLHVKGK